MFDKRREAKGERRGARGEMLMTKGGPKFKEFRVEFGRRVKSLRFMSIE